ncbi:MAG: DegQ family serine endoprotease [Alphaproteobacteria bacterium]|nr:DegQ family serine endoprotease [Alphaproteobacteria bacterium]
MAISARSFSQMIVGMVVLALMASQPAFARSGPPGFADLAEKLLPAVVNISTTQTISARDGGFPDFQLPPGSPFEDFFKDFLQQQPGRSGSHKHKATALGSGFIIDPTGYIVTNCHVIDGADEITVILQDDTNLSATVVGMDKKTDLALLKVSTKKPLMAVSFGDSDKIRVGDWVLAIGNPYGFGGSVTAGIISARARNINSGPYDEYLQTDAPINRGNSGGPMFNMDGEVVGINTAIISPSGGSVGLAFAIPSSLARNIVEQLKESGHIRRGWLGVRIQMVTQDIADGLDLGKARGALVSSVMDDGPAAKAGIKAGDVIVSFDGKDVTEMHKLPLIVAETEVDKAVDVVVFRKGKTKTLTVKVGEMPSKEDVADREEGDGGVAGVSKADKIKEMGASVSPLTDSLRERFEIGKDTKGVVIVSVDADGLAAEEGLRPGDVICEAAQQEVRNVNDLVSLVKKAKKEKKPLLLLVSHQDDLRFVALSFKEKN